MQVQPAPHRPHQHEDREDEGALHEGAEQPHRPGPRADPLAGLTQGGCAHVPDSRGLVLELADHRAVGDRRADLGLEAGDGAGLVGLERLLHLHRLEHHHDVALGDVLALLDGDLDDGALHRAGDGVTAGGRAGLLARPRLGFLAPPPAAPAAKPPSPAGSTTSSRLPPTSTTTVWRSPVLVGLGGLAGVGLDLVVEVGLDPGRVDVELALTAEGVEAPTYAGSSTTAGGTGSRSACRRRRTPSSARRDRSSAWVRSRPVTISLATSESNEPGMVSPAS